MSCCSVRAGADIWRAAVFFLAVFPSCFSRPGFFLVGSPPDGFCAFAAFSLIRHDLANDLLVNLVRWTVV